MIQMSDFAVTDTPDESDLNVLRDGLATHAKQHHIAPYRQDKLAVFARNTAGKIIGGATGFTVWQSLVLEMVWVDEAHRGKGLAKNLVERSEHEAVKRGCDVAYLWTAKFQAPGLYPKLGYTPMTGSTLSINETRRTYFMKRLAA
jgi:GNAT superfamily N-acetyltransferase